MIRRQDVELGRGEVSEDCKSNCTRKERHGLPTIRRGATSGNAIVKSLFALKRELKTLFFECWEAFFYVCSVQIKQVHGISSLVA